MFEQVILRRAENGPAITAGDFAEALLFYSRVHIILDGSSLIGLITTIGMPTLLSVLARKEVTATYCEDSPAVHTVQINGSPRHSFVTIMLAGNKESGPLRKRTKALQELLITRGYDKKPARRYVERFRKHVPIKRFGSNYFMAGGITQAANKDLLDKSYVQEVAKLSVADCGVEPPENLFFDTNANDQGISAHTNIDFEQINAARKMNGLDGDWTAAHILCNILTARSDIILASRYGGDFVTSNLISNIVRVKYRELLQKIELTSTELSEFREIIIEGAPRLREVIDSKERTFDEFLSLLDSAKNFKEWAHGVNPDKKIVRDYFDRLRSEGWINSIPGKAIRYVTTTAVGAIEPFTGGAISAADSFLVDKLAGGWKPGHFVETKLKPFLTAD